MICRTWGSWHSPRWVKHPHELWEWWGAADAGACGPRGAEPLHQDTLPRAGRLGLARAAPCWGPTWVPGLSTEVPDRASPGSGVGDSSAESGSQAGTGPDCWDRASARCGAGGYVVYEGGRAGPSFREREA